MDDKPSSTTTAASSAKSPVIAPKPGVVHVFRAVYDYAAQQDDELSFNEGDLLYVTEDTNNKDWLKARCGTKQGLIPANYVELKLNPVENPIHDASRRGNLDSLKELLSHGVSGGSLDSAGNSGLHWASRGGHLDCCELLIESLKVKGRNSFTDFLNVKNKLGETALHLASYKGHLPIVQLLLSSGSDPSLQNLNGEKAFDISSEADVKSILKQYEMELNEMERAGEGEEEYLDDDEGD